MQENNQQNKNVNETENNPIIIKYEERPIGYVIRNENIEMSERRRNKFGILTSLKNIIIYTSINIIFTIIELSTLITNAQN